MQKKNNNKKKQQQKNKHKNMNYVIRMTCGPRMGHILENVSYLRHSYLIQRKYRTNKHSHAKEIIIESWKRIINLDFDIRRAYWPLLGPYQENLCNMPLFHGM